MKRWFVLFLLGLSWLAASGSFCQESNRVPLPHSRKIYITSAFNCPVYWRNRQIATLRKGTPALIVKTAKSWILVRFRVGDRNVVGWIRR